MTEEMDVTHHASVTATTGDDGSQTYQLTVRSADPAAEIALTADLKAPFGQPQTAVEEAGKVLTDYDCWRLIGWWQIDDDAMTVPLEQYRTPRHPRVDIYEVADTEVRVAWIAGYLERHVLLAGDRFEVWYEDGTGEHSAPGWYTEVGGEIEGPWATADELIDEFYLDPEG